MAVRYYQVVILILLSLSASSLSYPVQSPETVFKRNTGEDGDQEETQIQTQIDQLYQIYQATQNNIKKINTEFNEQLANLRAEHNAIHFAMDVTKKDIWTEIETVQSSMNTLTTRVNSSVNPYQKCRQDTTSCTIQPSGPLLNYWVWCTTGDIPVNVTAYYTASMRFEIESNWDYPLESNIVRKRGGNYYGVCHVTWVDPHIPQHNPIKKDLVYICKLVITRCLYFIGA